MICKNLVASMSSGVVKDGKRTAGKAAPLSITSVAMAAVVSTVSASEESAVNAEIEYEIPPWAGRPPSGCHLDVLKGDQLIQVCHLFTNRIVCLLFQHFNICKYSGNLKQSFNNRLVKTLK